MIHQHIIPRSYKIFEYMLDRHLMLYAWIGLISTYHPYNKVNIWSST